MNKTALLAILPFFLLHPAIGDAGQPGETIVLPKGSNMKSVKEPNGNGKGACGFNLIWNAVEAHSKVRATFGVETFALNKSKGSDGNERLSGVEFIPLYRREAVIKAIADLNRAFGEGTARLLEPNDVTDGKLDQDKTGIVVSARFSKKNDPTTCSDLIGAQKAVFDSSLSVSNCKFLNPPYIFGTKDSGEKYCMGTVACRAITAYAVCKATGASKTSCPTADQCAESPDDADAIKPTLDMNTRETPNNPQGGVQ